MKTIFAALEKRNSRGRISLKNLCNKSIIQPLVLSLLISTLPPSKNYVFVLETISSISITLILKIGTFRIIKDH